MTDNKFPWDCEIPQTPFWADLEFTDGRNFIQAHTPGEFDALTPQLEAHNQSSKEDKYLFLLSELQRTLKAREAAVAPTTLYDADYGQWSKVLLAIETVQGRLGLPEEEQTLQTFIDNPKAPGGTDFSALNRLAVFKEKRGEYAEAEALARRVLPWMQNHEMLGKDSPQAFGTTRTIIRTVWKQGRFEDAQRLAQETQQMIDHMGDSKFVKYQEEEGQILRDMMQELKKWREEGTNYER